MTICNDKTNHAVHFNPYEHLKQSVKEDGLPAYKPYLKDGVVVIGSDDRVVMVPEAHLDANAYRDWFTKEYPDGRTEVIRHTEKPTVTAEGKVFYFQEVFEVKFYIDSDSEKPKTSGWGRAAYIEGNEFDEIGTAISLAYKNGMRNMGFGVDLDIEKIQEVLPKYIERTQPGKQVKFTPIIEAMSIQDETDESSKIQYQDVNQIMAENIPEGVSNSVPDVSNANILSYLFEKEQNAKEATETINQLSKNPEADMAGEVVIPPSDVIFSAISQDDPLSEFNGKTMGEILKINKSIIMLISRETFKWEGRLPENVYKAAKALIC